LVIGHWSFLPLRNSPQPTPRASCKNSRNTAQKFPSLTADFAEEKTTHLLTKPLVAQGTIAFQTPNKFRRELKGNTPSITVTDGAKLWIYYPSFKTAELYTLGQRQFFDDSIAASPRD
jgi:outer membrane lipoprotein-sorting protein